MPPLKYGDILRCTNILIHMLSSFAEFEFSGFSVDVCRSMVAMHDVSFKYSALQGIHAGTQKNECKLVIISLSISQVIFWALKRIVPMSHFF